MDPLLVLIATLGAAGITGLVAYLVAKRSTSGGIKETAADRLWGASEKMRDDLTNAVKAAEERDLAQQKEMVTIRKELADVRTEAINTRNEMIDKERASREQIEVLERTSRAEIEALTARVKDLEGQLAAALAEVAALRKELGKPVVT